MRNESKRRARRAIILAKPAAFAASPCLHECKNCNAKSQKQLGRESVCVFGLLIAADAKALAQSLPCNFGDALPFSFPLENGRPIDFVYCYWWSHRVGYKVKAPTWPPSASAPAVVFGSQSSSSLSQKEDLLGLLMF